MAPQRTKAKPSPRVIARRILQLAPDMKRITVIVETPEPDPESRNGDWRCAFRISGLGQARKQYAYGIDSFQSLQLAMVWIRHYLEPYRTKLSWVGGSLEAAFPMEVPYAWGPRFARQIERLIKVEARSLCREIEMREKRKAQIAASTR